MLKYGLHGPLHIQALVILASLFDFVRKPFNLNLGHLPMFLKIPYLRAFLFQAAPMEAGIGAPATTRNRAARRNIFFALPQAVRKTYYDSIVAWRGIPAVAGGAVVASRSGLFWTQVPGGLPVITDAKHFSGNVFFCDSGTAQGGTTAGYGNHPDQAFTDIESAYDQCTATQGDVIFVLPGHAETVTDEITMDAAGISIIGLGQGTARPTITQAFAGDAIAMDAANCVVENLYFNEATVAPAAGGAAIDINAATCRVANCHFDLGALDLEAITITATGDGAEVHGCTFLVTANGPDAAIELEAVVTEVHIHHNRFLGGSDSNAWDVGGINSGSAITQCQISHNDFVFGPANILSASATGHITPNMMSEGTLGSMLDPGSCMCHENYEADAIDQSARLFPTTVAS